MDTQESPAKNSYPESKEVSMTRKEQRIERQNAGLLLGNNSDSEEGIA